MSRVCSLALLCCAAMAPGAVVRVDIAERTEIPFAHYERLYGKVYFTVDPKLPANRKIADLDRAPRNAKGLVEFSADLLIYRPKDKGNGTALIDIPNRGGVSIISSMQVNAAGRGISPEDLGDLFLFEQGFTMMWIGWQTDLPEGPGVIRLHPPVAKGVTGPVRSEILVDRKTTSASLGDRTMIPYTVASAAGARMTVRDSPNAPRREIPSSQFKLNAGTIEYPAGFQPGLIYEVVYTGQDPAIAGLGLAAVRDYVAHVKAAGDVKRALAYGNSQSGRFLRTFLYDGFNADEHGKKVFDGVWAHISGAGNGGFNRRFAQPSRMAGEWNGIDNPVDLAPFTPTELLAGAVKARVAPKVFLTNGSHEYWGRAASLNHVTKDGHDAPLPDNVRMYYVSGTQHTSSANPANMKGTVQNPTNPLEWRPFLRAMLVAMNAWITDNTAPPRTHVPLTALNELVAPSAVKFPHIPQVAVPRDAYAPRLLDFGPEFLKLGIATVEPPKEGAAYATLVPQVNADGNEGGGVMLPELQFPLATYTGWNLRDPKAGAPEGLYPLIGSMIPFPRTKAEREKSGDPRLSIQERYMDRADYLRRVEASARQMVEQRVILERDVPYISARARARWDSLVTPAVAR